MHSLVTSSSTQSTKYFIKKSSRPHSQPLHFWTAPLQNGTFPLSSVPGPTTLVNICGFPSVLSAVVSAVRKPIQESDPKNACGCYFRPLVALASESRSQVIVCESDHAKLQMPLCAGGTNTRTTDSNQPLLAATYLQAATTSPLTGRTQSIRD
jgi:hypothetical protein